ncbi:MAG: class I SAM-dependent methyltransferase [Myxococcales bacterium]|nr:class I SAM-dependent methyltransferase [Myxococcales bacterium]
MDRRTYEIESQVERTHWWFRGRRKILTRLITGLSPALAPHARVLDVGCGTGANGPVLAAAGRTAIGVDASSVPLAQHGSGERGHTARVRGDAASLPFADGSFDLVAALDVLEHMDDDRAAAREFLRVLAPGGRAIIFVPALKILWGLQDDVSHHRRRYRRAELHAVLTNAGLEVERLTYFNTLLFPPILAARLAMRVRRPKHLASENQVGGRLTNALLASIFALEAPIVAKLDLPIGVSLACIARRA